MPTRPTFQRSPRTHFCRPAEGKVEVPAFPAAPQHPGFPWQGLTGGMSIAVLYFINLLCQKTGQANGDILAGAPIVGALVSLIQFGIEKGIYRKKCSLREKKYRALLNELVSSLNTVRDGQRSDALTCSPPPQECRRIVLDRDRRLWARSPRDNDFLSLRIGTGTLPFNVKLQPPLKDQALENDPLVNAAQEVIKDFSTISGMPVLVPLQDAGIVGIAGNRDQVLEMSRLLLVQMAAFHSPDELKIAAVYRQEDAMAWEWMRWLPHVWSDDYSSRFLSRSGAGNRALLKTMHDKLNRRRQAGRTEDLQPRLPVHVFIFPEPQAVIHEPLVNLLLSSGKSLGALSIFLADKEEMLPKECQALVTVDGESAHVKLPADSIDNAASAVDHISLDVADELARAMAPMSLQRHTGAGAPPPLVTLFEIMQCRHLQELNILNLWRSGEPFQSLSAPVGMMQGGELFALDIHEKAHGIHGLVAGTTGSGKSEFIQTFVASLAVHFHPHEMTFLFVDFKNGGTARMFRDIPHLAGIITELEGHSAEHVRASIDGERKRREKMLESAGVNTINEYIRKRRQGKAPEPLPLLLVVVDECAELAAQESEFMRELIRLARVGRRLGMFLLLGTQKPGGVVDEQLWSNCNYRVCFRVQTSQDSIDVLKCPDAASLTGSGRGYAQVGNNEIFTLFQAAWGGVPYSSGDYQALDSLEIVEVNLDGTKRSLTGTQAAGTEEAGTQIEVLLSHIAATARQAGIERLKSPWLQASS